MILFRADGNKNIGSGHIMRCLSIAKEAMKEDDVMFITADDTFHSVISGAGICNRSLHTDYTEMKTELEGMKDLISSLNPSFLFIDSYYVTEGYLNALKSYCNQHDCKLIYIDDMISFAFPCDILINYNVYANHDSYIDLYNKSYFPLPMMLIGTDYAPLRSDFTNIPTESINKTVRNILVSTGGTDPIHLALTMIERLKSSNKEMDAVYHILIGAMNSDKSEIEKLAANCQNVVIHYNVSDMRALICSCDIAVSAAGTTLYEICACGVPLITYILADNQINNAASFEKAELALNCGDLRGKDNKAEVLLSSITKLSNDYIIREKLHENMIKRVDGKGTERIIKAILTERLEVGESI